jgi:glycosyltransferase involved in cell wall biosynthesis
MKVSIGIPFYNAGLYFAEAINSVLKQSYKDFELILLDDGSTDNSLSIAYSFDDPRIKVESDGENKGLPTRLNQLISMSSGSFIARMDADDVISSTRIQKQVDFLNLNPSMDFVSTGICSVNENNHVAGYRNFNPLCPRPFIAADVIFGRVNIAHATIMARSSWYNRNTYNINAKLMEDYELWINAAMQSDLAVGFIHEPLYFYREASSISSKKAIKAYINQYQLIYYQYFEQLTLLQKIHFTLLTATKIGLTASLNLLGLNKILFKIRNKKTSQLKDKLKALQTEFNILREKK